jgi:hypothetical protein
MASLSASRHLVCAVLDIIHSLTDTFQARARTSRDALASQPPEPGGFTFTTPATPTSMATGPAPPRTPAAGFAAPAGVVFAPPSNIAGGVDSPTFPDMDPNVPHTGLTPPFEFESDAPVSASVSRWWHAVLMWLIYRRGMCGRAPSRPRPSFHISYQHPTRQRMRRPPSRLAHTYKDRHKVRTSAATCEKTRCSCTSSIPGRSRNGRRAASRALVSTAGRGRARTSSARPCRTVNNARRAWSNSAGRVWRAAACSWRAHGAAKRVRSAAARAAARRI